MGHVVDRYQLKAAAEKAGDVAFMIGGDFVAGRMLLLRAGDE